MKILLIIVGSYLIGSFPTAYLMGRLSKGIDIREHGSRNVGATNVFRLVGKIPGIITLFIDILKGLGVILFIQSFIALPNTELIQILAGLTVITGHNWTFFLHFKGGKGVATSTGVFLGLAPMPVLAALLIFLVVFLITGKVSLASVISVFIFPFVVYFLREPKEILLFSSIIAFVIIVKHIPNIKRLMKGAEEKIIN